MTIDLDMMSRGELEKLRRDIDKAISTLADRDRKKAIAAAEKAAAEHGFSLADLTGKAKRAGQKSAAKYRNPANPAQTWTGKGRRPGWIKAAQESGKELSAFEI